MRRLHWNQYYFIPKLLPTIATLLLLPCLISLGFWQLHRAAIKRQLQTEFNARKKSKPLTLAQLPLGDLRYYRIKLTGRYDNQHQFLLDNRIYKHQVGYQVLTPLIITQSHKAVLVNRGWIPRHANRQHLPNLKFIKGQQTILGSAYLSNKKGLVLNQQQDNPGQWPRIVQQPDIKQLNKELPYPLYPFVLLLSPKANNGFVRDWRPVTMPAYKHIAYAVQWFVLALALMIIYIVVNFRKDKDTHED